MAAILRAMDIAPSVLALIGGTPLVRLHRVAAATRVPVLAKCEFLNPGGSLKDRIALAIVEAAERGGRLLPGGTIIEATGGNTGVGLALVANLKGYRLICVLPEKMSHDKRLALAVLGATVVVTKDAPPDDPANFQNVAARLARERGFVLADQFRVRANVEAHVRTTAQEILRQTGGEIGAFVAGVGTGGTISGVGRVLKEQVPGVRIVLADPVGSKLAGWVRCGEASQDGKYQLEGMGGSKSPETFDMEVCDDAISVSDDEAFAMTHRLIREEGLLCGGSSGGAVVAAIRVASDPAMRAPVVTVLADSWDRYWSKPWMQAAMATILTIEEYEGRA